MDRRRNERRALSENALPLPRSLRVIVADDERDTVLTLIAILRDEGHTVRGLHSGKEVLAAISQDDPHAVILDIDMPGQSGYELAREIRRTYGDKGPMLIGISGRFTKHSDALLARSTGFNHYCVKPCDPNDLLKLLKPLTYVHS